MTIFMYEEMVLPCSLIAFGSKAVMAYGNCCCTFSYSPYGHHPVQIAYTIDCSEQIQSVSNGITVCRIDNAPSPFVDNLFPIALEHSHVYFPRIDGFSPIVLAYVKAMQKEIMNQIKMGCQQTTKKEFSIRIIIFQRVVQAVAIAVEILAVPRLLHIVVGAEEAGVDGIVETSVHVDEAEVIEHLMAGEAAIEADVVLQHLLHAPRVVAGGEDRRAHGVHYLEDAAQMVGLHVVELVDARRAGDTEHAAVEVGVAGVLGAVVAGETFLVVTEVVAQVALPPLAVGHCEGSA